MLINYLKTVFQGALMGIVETIPGVSASTLALIMGIYDRFVDILHEVSDVFKETLLFLAGKSTPTKIWKKIIGINYKFGAPLFVGMLLGIAIFSHIMSFLLKSYAVYTYAFFFGLIVASVTVPWGRIDKKTKTEYMIALFTTLLFFVFLGLKPAVISGIPSPLLIFVGGFFAICAMVLPGISGSFVLLLFGLYDFVIEAVKNLTKLNASQPELVSLGALGFGLVLGFGSFVRLLKYILTKYPSYLMSFLVGLMLGSLRVLWPFALIEQGSFYFLQAVTSTIIIFITSVAVLMLNKFTKKNKEVLDKL